MQIDGYRVLRISHEGSYGPVVQAEDTQSGKLVAIQVFTGPFKQPQASVQGLQAHLQTLQSLNLPGVAIPLRCGELPDGRLFLTSAWVAGSTLPAGRQPLAEALYWAQRIAAALEVAHRHGIYHQHLRPSQILHSAGRSARQCTVLGMGLARLFGLPVRTQVSASLAFLAPERRHDEGGAAADVYSLGVLLRALTGLPASPPEPAGSQSIGEMFVALPIMEQVALLIAKMTATDPAQRLVMSEVNVHLYRLCKLRPVGLRVPRLGGERELPKGDLRARSTLDIGTDNDLDITITMPRERLPAETPVVSDKDPLIGQAFGQFRLLRRLGSGAMGTVYEGRHELIGHRAAVKVLRPQFGSSREYARRFIDEARAVNIVEHRGLVSVTDCDQREDGLLFTVMELLSGETLEAALARRTAPPKQREALGILLQIARALAATHARGIIHRGLKPCAPATVIGAGK